MIVTVLAERAALDIFMGATRTNAKKILCRARR